MLTTEQRLRMLETPQKTFDLVIDTDAYNEIDDQFAISYALRAQDRLHLLALCAAPFHNERSTGPADGMEKSYQEILKLLSLAGENVPVYRGSTTYLPDEKTPVPSDAAQALAQLAMEHTTENPLYVAAIGAITNVASALLMQPEIADRMVLVWLGGSALHWPDNQEFNILQDVAAARVRSTPACRWCCCPATAWSRISPPPGPSWNTGSGAKIPCAIIWCSRRRTPQTLMRRGTSGAG